LNLSKVSGLNDITQILVEGPTQQNYFLILGDKSISQRATQISSCVAIESNAAKVKIP